MPHPSLTIRRAGAAAVALAAALALSACASGPLPGSGSSGGTSAGASSTTDPALLSEAYTGYTEAPPTDEVAVTKGKKVWIVSCGESITTCANPSHGALDAAKAIGWTGSICDGKLSPPGWSACIRQGISAKADVIMTAGLDCATISGALGEAKAAKIMTIGIAGNDCDVSGGSKQFSTTTLELKDRSNAEWWQLLGGLQAKWLVGQTGTAKVLQLQFGDAIWGPDIVKGFDAELAKHKGSSVVATLKLGNADVAGGALSQKFSTALLKNSSVNAVAVPLDGWFLAGLGQAVKSSGRDLKVIGGLGSIPNYGLIGASGGEDATVAFSGVWDGWSGIDAALRLYKGQPVLPAGNGLQVVDRTNGLPANGKDFTFSPAIDFVAKYKAAWGVS